MGDRFSQAYKLLVAILGGVEIAVRSLGSAVDQVGSIIEVVVAVTIFIEGTDQLEFIAGWLFFASLIYWVAPLLFAQMLGNEVRTRSFRLGVTIGAVGIGIVSNVVLLESLGIDIPVDSDIVTSVVLASGLGYIVFSTIGLYSHESGGDTIGELVVVTVLGTVPVLLLGVYLTGAALLYPLPELFVLCWGVYAFVVTTAGIGQGDLWVNDPVERLGVIPAYSVLGIQGFITTAYIFVGIALSVYPYALFVVTLSTEDGAGVVSGPMILFVTAAFMAAYGTWYWLRIGENRLVELYQEFETTPPKYLQRLYGRDGDSTSLSLPPYVPGLCLPIGIFSFTLVALSPEDPNTVPLAALVLATIALIIAVGTIVLTRRASTSTTQDFLISEWNVVPASVGILVLANLSGVTTIGWLVNTLLFGGTMEFSYDFSALFVPIVLVLELVILAALITVFLLPYYTLDIFYGGRSLPLQGLALGSFGLIVLVPVTVVAGFETWVGELLTWYLWIMMAAVVIYAILWVR